MMRRKKLSVIIHAEFVTYEIVTAYIEGGNGLSGSDTQQQRGRTMSLGIGNNGPDMY